MRAQRVLILSDSICQTAKLLFFSLSPELGFTRVQHYQVSKSDKSDFGWGEGRGEGARTYESLYALTRLAAQSSCADCVNLSAVLATLSPRERERSIALSTFLTPIQFLEQPSEIAPCFGSGDGSACLFLFAPPKNPGERSADRRIR